MKISISQQICEILWPAACSTCGWARWASFTASDGSQLKNCGKWADSGICPFDQRSGGPEIILEPTPGDCAGWIPMDPNEYIPPPRETR